MNYYRGPVPYDSRFFPPGLLIGAPLLGGFVGGLLGSAILRPRPYPYPYPYPPPYGGPVPYGYGNPYW